MLVAHSKADGTAKIAKRADINRGSSTNNHINPPKHANKKIETTTQAALSLSFDLTVSFFLLTSEAKT